MSAWRRKAIEAFPDLRWRFQKPESTIYEVSFNLSPRVEAAHERDDTPELRRIYDFAHWCFRQRADHLWNAAGVAFYEHLVDEPTTLDQMPRWLEPDVFEGCQALFARRLETDAFQNLCEAYHRQRKTS